MVIHGIPDDTDHQLPYYPSGSREVCRLITRMMEVDNRLCEGCIYDSSIIESCLDTSCLAAKRILLSSSQILVCNPSDDGELNQVCDLEFILLQAQR